MPPSCHKFWYTNGIITVLLLSSILVIQPVMALKVVNPKIMADVVPGQTYQFPMAVSIDMNDPATDVAIDVLGFGQSPGGSYSWLTPAQDTGPYSARSFVAVDSSLLHLNPGQRIDFNATIRVPQNVGEGGRYALIFIHPPPTGSGLVATITVPVMLTMKGTTLIHTGTITNLQAGEEVTGRPIEIRTTLQNTGNHHYYGALVNITVTDSAGNLVARESTTTIFALIPENQMTFATPITSTLSPGTYTVKSEAKLADGMALLDSKTATFTIQTPYVPPTPQTTITGGAQVPTGTTATPVEAEGPKKVPFLPIYTPGPDALVIIEGLSVAFLLWTARLRR